MGMSTADLIRKAAGAVTTASVPSSGTLSPEQSTAFLDAVQESTPFTQAQRNERRDRMSGTIAKIGIGGRILRKKTEAVDDATLIGPTFGDIAYQVERYRVDAEISEETFEENIEREGFEDHNIRLITGQVGRDLEDLHFNGDEASSDAFLSLNTGWLKQLATAGLAHRVNGGAIDSGAATKGQFFAGLAAMPNKYKGNGRLRWIGSPAIFAAYIEYLSNRGTPAGDAALLDGSLAGMQGIPFLPVPAMSTDRLILADPKNFIVVTTRDIRYRKTTEGREAIRRDVRFYAWFLGDDPIIEEQDAIVDIYGLVP